MSDLKHVILNLVQKHLPNEEHFIVEVKVDWVADKTKIIILVDADQGMTIAACASLSRALSGELETNEQLDEAYISGEEIVGKLKDVEEQGIKLLVTKKEKGKKSIEEEQSISYNEIKKSIVQVSFN